MWRFDGQTADLLAEIYRFNSLFEMLGAMLLVFGFALAMFQFSV